MADKKEYSFEELVNIRKKSWDKSKDANQDQDIIRQIANQIVSSKKLQKQLKDDPTLLIECTFTVVNKDKKTVPFFLNEVQKDFLSKFRMVEEDKKKCDKKGKDSKYLQRPFIILKGRQQGFTTLITAIQLCYAISMRNFSGMTIADTETNTDSIFQDKAKFFFDFLPDALKPTPKFSNRKELMFKKLYSSWRVQFASNEMGRSRTLNFVHDSEVATFKCNFGKLQAAIGQALTSHSIVIYESTANGYNEFKDLWDGGFCINCFYEWWRTPEYRNKNIDIISEVDDDWLKTRIQWLREEKNLSDEQIAWYIYKWLSFPKSDRKLIKQEYPCTPEEAFLSSGSCFFDAEQVSATIDKFRSIKPLKTGYFKYNRKLIDINKYQLTDIQWVDSSEGLIEINEEPYVKEEIDLFGRANGIKYLYPYTIGGDTAGAGYDYFTAKVVNNITRRTAATLRKQQMDDDYYAEQVACLGYMYHEALIAIETNYSIAPNRYLEFLEYPNIFRRIRLDSIGNPIEKKIGFETNKLTRPIILSSLKKLLRDDPEIDCNIETLKEFLAFCVLDPISNKVGAVVGCHDDLVMALAIAHYALENQGTFEPKMVGKIDKSLYNEFYEPEEEEEEGGYGEWFLPK